MCRNDTTVPRLQKVHERVRSHFPVRAVPRIIIFFEVSDASPYVHPNRHPSVKIH
jgi:hypothetical protein